MLQTKEEIGIYWIPSLNQELPNYLNFSLRQALFSPFCRWRISDSGSPPWYELSRVQLFVSPGTLAHQAPLSMDFSRQDYGSELLFPFPGDLPSPGIEPGSHALQADSLPSELPGKPSRSLMFTKIYLKSLHIPGEWKVKVRTQDRDRFM